MKVDKWMTDLVITNYFLSNHSSMELGDDSFIGLFAS
jgi:hypothetical protein